MQARLEKISPGSGASFHCHRRRDRRFGFAWHFHPELELTYIVRSRGKRFVGDSIEHYGDGDLVLLGPNLPHTWDSDPGRGRNEAVVCQFSPDFLGHPFLGAPEMAPVRRLLERSAAGLRFSGTSSREAGKILDGLDRRRGPTRILGLLQVLEILSRSRQVTPLASREFVPSLRRQDTQRIDRVCRFLSEHYTDRVPLAEAAKIAHLSVPAFCRFFRRRTRKTLVEYLSELRVGHACRELIETDRPIAEIAFESGFSNLSNFNRRFLRSKLLSPRAFRSQFQYRSGNS
jgi:AraC-like DNA-binding protein